MRFKALLASVLPCLMTVPASAATYIGTLNPGDNLVSLGEASGRSIRANIVFSAPVNVSLERHYLRYDGLYDRKTGITTYRSDDRQDGAFAIQSTRLQAKFTGFERFYFKNFVRTRISYFNSFEMIASANEATSYIATINMSGVPEPSTWSLMILGIGLAGVSLRRRRASPMLV